MPDQKISRLRLLLALLITVFLFVNVFLFAYSVSFLKKQKVSEIEADIRYSLLSFNIEKELLTTCDDSILEVISEDLEEVGSIVSILEDRLGKKDSKVLEQKKLYVLMEIQHFLNIKEYNSRCEEDKHIVLFFYSNEDNFKYEAENIGKTLDTFKSQNNDVMIYSFDYDLDFKTIDILKKVNGVSNPNVVVFDGSEPFLVKGIDVLNAHLN